MNKLVLCFCWAVVLPVSAQGRISQKTLTSGETTIRFRSERIIPHLTDAQGNFITTVLVENDTEFPQQYTLYPLKANGEFALESNLEDLRFTIEPLSVSTHSARELFGEMPISHLGFVASFLGFFAKGLPDSTIPDFPFPFGARGQLKASLLYSYAGGGGSPALVGEVADQGSVWRLHPGNWEETFDGLAVLNVDTVAGDVQIRQVDFSGNLIQEETLAEGLLPNAKALYVLGSTMGSPFTPRADAYFEIRGDQHISVTALRGSENRFLWKTEATVMRRMIPVLTTCEIPDQVVVDESFTLKLGWEHTETASVTFRPIEPLDCEFDLSDPFACQLLEVAGITFEEGKPYSVLVFKQAGTVEVEILLENKNHRTTVTTRVEVSESNP